MVSNQRDKQAERKRQREEQMKYTIDMTAEQVDEMVSNELIWMHQNAELTEHERKCYEIVIRDYLNPVQWKQFMGEEIDE